MSEIQIERERRWLLKTTPNKNFFNPALFSVEKIKIKQFYFGRPAQRIRMSALEDGSFTFEHFVKEWIGDGASTEKVSILEADEFKRLVDEEAVTSITKTRTKVKLLATGVVFEFDHISRKTLADVHLVEVEFANQADQEAFVLPNILQDFLIAEITNARQFSNYHLSERF
jgi:CYTH domain-containing protein